jgi:[ribosomal protein S18]-alanine N-acetyltransferase
VKPDWIVEPLSSALDLDAVVAIEESSFTNPWTREMYLAELANRDVSYCYVVRDAGGVVVGFCSFWRVADELHINNFAVVPKRRGAGAGTTLLREVMHACAGMGARRATLEVRRSNEDAIRLYERLGFRQGGVRPSYYTSPVEDALILWNEELDAV